MDEIAVLIPCYNESRTIEKVVRDFRRALPNAVIYVYDNNSKDGTDEIARRAGAVVRYEYQQGKGNVIRRMFREIDAKCYVMTDGDDSMFKSDIRDIMTGYRAFSYQFVKSFPVLSKGFEIETEMSIHAIDKNMRVENVIIQYRDRPEGSESKLNTYSDGFKVIMTIVRLYKNYKPMGFFSWIAVALALLSTAFLAPVMGEYLDTGLVERFPTLIVCCFVYMAAMQSFFAGLMLSTMKQKNMQDYEMNLILLNREYKKLLAVSGDEPDAAKQDENRMRRSI